MSYETLYRKYRPQRFEEVVGQPHVVQTLQNALRFGRIAHAYLFCGQRGTGKTTTARILAKAVNCEIGPTPAPCCECEHCKAIQSGTSLDLIELDAASHTKVDQIREVIVDKVAFVPASARYRVYIIDEVHMLSTSSFNALLKTLEEPPPHALFVLCTTDPHKIPATIHSRCQRFDFRRVSAREIAARLERVVMDERRQGNLEVDVDPAALLLIARVTEGSVRDALSILEQVLAFAGQSLTVEQVRQVLGMTEEDLLFDLTKAIAQNDVAQAWQLIDRAANGGKDLQQLVKDLVAHLRDLLVVKVNAEAALLEYDEARLQALREQAALFSEAELPRIIEGLFSAEQAMRTMGDLQLALELSLLKAMPRLTERVVGASCPEFSAAQDAPPTQIAAAPVPPPQVREAAPEEPEELSALNAMWQRLLQQVKEKNIGAYFCLREGKPTAIENGTLTVTFAHPFYRDQIMESSYRHVVQEELQQVLGEPVRLRCVVSEQFKEQANFLSSIAQEMPAADVSPPRLVTQEEDAAQILLSLFPDAQVIEEEGA